MIKPEVLDALVAAGCTAEQIAAAVKADIGTRSTNAERYGAPARAVFTDGAGVNPGRLVLGSVANNLDLFAEVYAAYTSTDLWVAVRVQDQFLDNEAARRFSASLWTEGKEALARYAESPDSRAPGMVEHALTSFGQKALDDPELLAKVDDLVVDIAVFIVARYQDEVADLIAHNRQLIEMTLLRVRNLELEWEKSTRLRPTETGKSPDKSVNSH